MKARLVGTATRPMLKTIAHNCINCAKWLTTDPRENHVAQVNKKMLENAPVILQNVLFQAEPLDSLDQDLRAKQNVQDLDNKINN